MYIYIYIYIYILSVYRFLYRYISVALSHASYALRCQSFCGVYVSVYRCISVYMCACVCISVIYECVFFFFAGAHNNGHRCRRRGLRTPGSILERVHPPPHPLLSQQFGHGRRCSGAGMRSSALLHTHTHTHTHTHHTHTPTHTHTHHCGIACGDYALSSRTHNRKSTNT